MLLKLLNDILDEGYKDAYINIDTSCNVVQRLKSFIISNREVPFTLNQHVGNRKILYKEYEYILEDYLHIIEKKTYTHGLGLFNVPSIFYDILAYSKSIFDLAKPDCAYIF